jgi:hypothetical protein
MSSSKNSRKRKRTRKAEAKENKQVKKPKTAEKTKTWVRIQELNGWEREEWFRYYVVPDAKTKKAWTKLQTRLKKYNKEVAKARWTQIQQAVKDQKQDARAGFVLPLPVHANGKLTEFHVDFVHERDLDAAVKQQEDQEDAEKETEDDQAHIDKEWKAFKKGEAAYKKAFYNMGNPNTQIKTKHRKYMEEDAPETNAILEVAAAASDVLKDSMYRSTRF